MQNCVENWAALYYHPNIAVSLDSSRNKQIWLRNKESPLARLWKNNNSLNNEGAIFGITEEPRQELSIYLSIYLSIFLSIYLSIYLSIVFFRRIWIFSRICSHRNVGLPQSNSQHQCEKCREVWQPSPQKKCGITTIQLTTSMRKVRGCSA